MKKLLLFIFMAVMLAGSAFATTSITTPADSATLTNGAAYTYTASSDVGGNCSYFYRHKGTTDWTTIGTTNASGMTVISTVPDSFGTNQFNVSCTNATATETDATTESISITTYDAGEISEVVTDSLMGIGIAILSFASLIALVGLFVWAKKKL